MTIDRNRWDSKMPTIILGKNLKFFFCYNNHLLKFIEADEDASFPSGISFLNHIGRVPFSVLIPIHLAKAQCVVHLPYNFLLGIALILLLYHHIAGRILFEALES